MPEIARTPTHVWMQLRNASYVMAYQVLGIFSTSTPSHFNAALSTLTYYLSYIAPPHFNFTSFYQCTALIIPNLTTLLQLKYQGTDQSSSPFATHPTTMSIIVSSSAINYLAYMVLLRLPHRRCAAAAAYLCSVCSSYASVASLASLLFSDSVRPYVCSVFGLISAAEVLYFCRRLMKEEGDEGAGFRACRRRMSLFLNYLRRFWANPNQRRLLILPI